MASKSDKDNERRFDIISQLFSFVFPLLTSLMQVGNLGRINERTRKQGVRRLCC